MNIRPKTVRRLVILLAACVLIVAAGASVLYYSHRSKARAEQAARADGLDAFQSENYPVALEKLRPIVAKHPDDYDAMYALAVSRSRVETANGRHLVEAKTLFEQLHTERPDDMQVAHHLLSVYEQIGYLSEAQRVAGEILDRDPKDIEALRAKAESLARANKYPDALTVAQKLNDVAPLDLDGQIQTLTLLHTLKHSPMEIVEHYQKLQQAHADDPRFEMLLGLAYLNAEDQPNALKWLRSAAKRTPPDAAFVQRLSQCFDNLKLFNESRDLLERSANSNHPDIVKILIQRLWQGGQFNDVVDRLAKLDPNAETSDPDLLAFKALALYQLKKDGDADAIVAALKNRKTSSKASAWAAAMQSRFNPSLAPKDAVKAYEDALSRDRENAVLRCWMGESYMQLGEAELAMQEWRQASILMPSWGHPNVLLARALLKRGQTEQALQQAADAFKRAQNMVESGTILAQAWFQHLQENPDPQERDRLIGFITDFIQKGAPGEPETLPLLAELQAQAGKRDEAIATIRGAIAKDGADHELMLSLADVSRREKLGIENEILAKLPADASSSPRLALQRALDLARAGKKDEGSKLLSDPSHQSVQWKVAQAEYLEATNDPKAKDAWIALGDQNKDNVQVQNLILKEAQSATTDRDFFARTIDRLHNLTGDDALGWRFARAKYLLTSEDKRRDSAEAVAILRQLVGQSPDTTEYRVLLAAGLVNLGDTNGAIEHLKAAVERDNASADTMLDLIKMLLAQNRVDEARAYMDRAARATNLPPADRKPLAILLARQGQIQPAMNLLAPVADALDPEGKLFYAELLRQRGETAKAEAIYNQLLADPNVSTTAIASAADFFASTNRVDDAKKLIAKLDDARFDKKQRNAIVARFDEQYGNKDDARDLLIAATDASPTDAGAWQSLIEFYIRNSQYEHATDTANEALVKLPNNDAIVTLKAQATALASAKTGQSDLRPLIDVLSKDPKNAAQVEMLRTIQDAQQTKQSPQQVVAKLKTVADKYPNYWPLQEQLVRAYMEMNQPNDAAPIVEHLMDARPNDSDIAKLAVSVYRSTGRWRDVKRAGEKWRQRTLENPTDADIAIAEADLALGDTQSATDRLTPYLASVKENPQRSAVLTAAIAKLLIATNKLDDARAMLQPLLDKGPQWRRLWLSLGAGNITPATTATEWIKTAAATIPADSPDEQFTLARAWQEMGSRLSDKAAIASARTILQTLAARKDAGPQPMTLLASLDTDAGDLSAAEDLYRRALKLDGNLPDALNNLAYILLERNGDLNEARDLATRAIAVSPSVGAFHDTLARINEKLDKRDEAQSEFAEALRLDPTSLDARIGLCRTLSLAGQRDKAQQEFQRIETQLNGAPPASESTRRELETLRASLSSSSIAE